MWFPSLFIWCFLLSIICTTFAFLKTARRPRTTAQGFTISRLFCTTTIPPPCLNNDIISWDVLDSLLRKQEPRIERTAFDVVTSGRGNAHTNARIRLFDASENFTPTITVYRDASAWCPYCERVWLLLEEKRVPYNVVTVPMSCYGEKPTEFFQLSPSGNIPVAMIQSRVVLESKDIMMDIERTYTDGYRRLLPQEDDVAGNARVTSLLALERRTFNAWLLWINCVATVPFKKDMDERLLEIDNELAKAADGGPFFFGVEPNLVDCVFAPFLERMAASLPYYKGFAARSERYPNLLRWYKAMDKRPSYRGIKSDYYSHCHDLPPQVGKCYFSPEAAPFTTEIDGGAWSVTKTAADCLEPMLPLDANEARRDAARQLVSNRKQVVLFAMRAIGDLGPSVRAPLANPYAQLGDEASLSLSVSPAVDFALRTITQALLSHGAEASSSSPSLPFLSDEEKQLLMSKQYPRTEVVACLTYLRDRVGVPRDMTVHGARQLRAHINWLLDHIKE